MPDNDRGVMRVWLGPVVGLLATIAVNVVANLLAAQFPQVLKDYPLLSLAPWLAIAVSWAAIFWLIAERGRNQKWKGIEASTGLVKYVKKLEGSGYYPSECLVRIDAYLDFMGHGASKWTHERNLMDQMLQRTFSNGGQVRFLLLDPSSDACLDASRAYHNSRDDYARKILESLLVLRSLRMRYRHLQVRLYAHRPQFRLTFDDRDSVSVGHYMGYRRGSANSPLLHFTKHAEWSCFTAFMTYFEDEWEHAKEVDWASLDEQLRALVRAE